MSEQVREYVKVSKIFVALLAQVNTEDFSGGKFLEKTRIPLPGGKGVLGAKHFQVGGTFVASAREFKILECDAFTEAFMNSM